MKKSKRSAVQGSAPLGDDFFGRLWQESWTYIKTVVDVVREPVVILDKNLCVMTANEPFYRLFQVDPKDTEGKNIYKLGNGQWDIPLLRKLLEDVLPKNTFFRGFEVSHDFPIIGRKIMILNARRIHFEKDAAAKPFPPIILLAIEDVTEMMGVAEAFTAHKNEFEAEVARRAEALDIHIQKLEKEIDALKKRF